MCGEQSEHSYVCLTLSISIYCEPPFVGLKPCTSTPSGTFSYAIPKSNISLDQHTIGDYEGITNNAEGILHALRGFQVSAHAFLSSTALILGSSQFHYRYISIQRYHYLFFCVYSTYDYTIVIVLSILLSVCEKSQWQPSLLRRLLLILRASSMPLSAPSLSS